MHFDWQFAAAAAIVVLAAWHVGRIIAGQISGFRKAAKPGASGCGGCDVATKPAGPQLIALSATPPRRVVVPRADTVIPQNDK